MTSTITIAQDLIRKASVTPDDQGCQDLVADQLQPYGFRPEFMQFGAVRNLWLRRGARIRFLFLQDIRMWFPPDLRRIGFTLPSPEM